MIAYQDIEELLSSSSRTIDDETSGFPDHLKDETSDLIKNIHIEDLFDTNIINKIENVDVDDSEYHEYDSQGDIFDIDKEEDDDNSELTYFCGGGWKDENSDTLGKTFESLNIYDFFGSEEQIKIISPKGYSYYINLLMHDKIFEDVNSNYEGNLQGKRINYEKLQQNQRGYYDILCREPYMLYSYDKKPMDITFDDVYILCHNQPSIKNTFNTGRILLCESDAEIASDILNMISEYLLRDNDSITILSQFRRYCDHVSAPPLRLGENNLNAMFLFSSVIRGMNPIKLLYQKQIFKRGVLGGRAIPPNLTDIIQLITDNDDDNGFKILAKALLNFYRNIANIAGIEDDTQIFL